MAEPISILIVEDEVLIGKHLAICLEDEGYRVHGIVSSFEEATTQLKKELPSLVLLDINLGGLLDGIDLAGELRHQYQVPFIFITSNTDARTVSRAKLTEPAGFIVKPFQANDLRPSIEIALHRHQQQAAPIRENEQHSFFIKERHEMKRLYYAEIDYVEAADNYSIIHTPEHKHILSQTLKSMETKLVPFGFLRVHRSFLVNVSKINCVRPTEVIIGEKAVPISANSRSELMKFIRTL